MSKTELTLIERAAVALGGNDAELKALAKESAEIVVVTNKDGFAQAQTARMKLRAARIETEKRGKLSRDDANAFSKAVIAEEKRLVAIVQNEELRLGELQESFTAKIEAERQAKIQDEDDRKDAIQARIDDLNADLKFGDDSKTIKSKLDRVTAIEIGNQFDERRAEAEEIREGAMQELRGALEYVIAAEQATANQAAAAEVLRVESERLQGIERDARIKAEQDAEEQREFAEKAAHETARIKAEQVAAEQRVEAEKRAAEDAARESRLLAAEKETAKLKAEARAVENARIEAEAERIETERKAAAAPDKERMIAFAESLISLRVPDMSTAHGKEAAIGIEQALLNLHKRIVAKAEEL